MSNNTTQEVSIIEKSMEVFRSGGEILVTNQQRTAKAVAVGKTILQAIREQGMTPELDERAMKYLVNCSKAMKEENESRSVVTQLMDEIKKMYIACEKEIDVKQEGTYPNLIQKERNDYARKIAEEKRRREEEARIIAEKAKEEIDIRQSLEAKVFSYYSQFLANAKTKLLNNFNALTLETISAAKDSLESWNPEYPFDHLTSFKSANYSKYLNADEFNAIFTNVVNGKYPEFKSNYSAELHILKREIIDRIPSKMTELQEAAERERQIAAEKDEQIKRRLEEAKRMAEREARLRAEAEEKRIAREQEEARKNAELEASIKAEGEKTMVLFEQEAASTIDVPAPEVRTGYDIEVTHQAGYVQLFQLWFEQEGKSLPLDKIEKTSFGQIKAWAEKKAHKDGEKIESKFLIYRESYKAVNRKIKAE
jgi:hypothetical protein